MCECVCLFCRKDWGGGESVVNWDCSVPPTSAKSNIDRANYKVGLSTWGSANSSCLWHKLESQTYSCVHRHTLAHKHTLDIISMIKISGGHLMKCVCVFSCKTAVC